MERSHIKQLSPHLVNQIAAGEVVERPASAIKELLDNSIDAGATSIQVQVLSADGRSFRIIDNGCGIPEDEIELAFASHATSKIVSLDDLNNLYTKGFRGEALASISAVSQVTCLSKTPEATNAYKAAFDKNAKLNIVPTAFAGGTCFEVRELFSNVPVRLKFLKKAETELQAIQDVVRELAIAHPQISFSLEIKDKNIFKTTASGHWELAVKEAFQESSSNFKYLEVSREEAPLMTLKGLVAPLSDARSDARAIITIVNQRPIKCDIMRKAIRSVYHGFLPSGKHPRIILSLSLAPNLVDVNVHPTKKEVRYTAPNVVYQLVQNALEKHLILQSSLKPVPEIVESASTNQRTETTYALPSSGFERPTANTKNYSIDKINYERKPLFETGLKTISEEEQKEEKLSITEHNAGSLHLSKVSELSLRKVFPAAKNKSSKADKGSSTDFTIQSGTLELSGQVSGPKWIRDKYLEAMNQWVLSVELDLEQYETPDKQTHIFPVLKKTGRPHISAELLEKVWHRDGWRCVYCGKHLLHPKLVKKALRHSPDGWISRLGSNNKLLKTHLLREHQAAYDHYLPFTHNPSLSSQEDNLFACCRACNQAKSSSVDTNKWKPQKFEAWTSPQIIGSLVFNSGDLCGDFKALEGAGCE